MKEPRKLSWILKRVSRLKSNDKKQQQKVLHIHIHNEWWMVLIGNVCLCNKRNGKHTSTVHGYLQDKQTDEKTFSEFQKREKTRAHTHTHRFHYTNNERSSFIGATAKERRDNNNKSTRTHTPNRTEQGKAMQSKAHKSLNNWYEAKIVFESTLHVTYYSLKRDIHTHKTHTFESLCLQIFNWFERNPCAPCLCFFLV